MKKFKFALIFCCCLGFSKTAENDTIDYSDFEKQNVYLNLENSELRVNNSQIALNCAKLQKDYFETRQKLNKVTSYYATLNSNCSVLADQIAVLVDSFQTVSENIKPLKRNQFYSELPKNCAQASEGKSGIYTIAIPHSSMKPFEVACDTQIHEGNWLVIQRRMDGSVDFHRPWLDYKNGFGNLEGEFFIGLDKLYMLTAYMPHELLIVLKDFNDETKYITYDYFRISNEREQYTLKSIGEYSGTETDSLRYHVGRKFSTYDNDNDQYENCAQKLYGGWWYGSCQERSVINLNRHNYYDPNPIDRVSNLNGLYLNGSYLSDYKYGVTWDGFYGDFYSLKFVQIMIQPKKFYRF